MSASRNLCNTQNCAIRRPVHCNLYRLQSLHKYGMWYMSLTNLRHSHHRNIHLHSLTSLPYNHYPSSG